VTRPERVVVAGSPPIHWGEDVTRKEYKPKPSIEIEELVSLKYSVVLEPAEEGGYSVYCVELPAAISQGSTKEEAVENIKEAIKLVIEVRKEQGAVLGELTTVDVIHA
jgi:predicted RNase H-like HicB family nuclease